VWFKSEGLAGTQAQTQSAIADPVAGLNQVALDSALFVAPKVFLVVTEGVA